MLPEGSACFLVSKLILGLFTERLIVLKKLKRYDEALSSIMGVSPEEKISLLQSFCKDAFQMCPGIFAIAFQKLLHSKESPETIYSFAKTNVEFIRIGEVRLLCFCGESYCS